MTTHSRWIRSAVLLPACLLGLLSAGCYSADRPWLHSQGDAAPQAGYSSVAALTATPPGQALAAPAVGMGAAAGSGAWAQSAKGEQATSEVMLAQYQVPAEGAGGMMPANMGPPLAGELGTGGVVQYNPMPNMNGGQYTNMGTMPQAGMPNHWQQGIPAQGPAPEMMGITSQPPMAMPGPHGPFVGGPMPPMMGEGMPQPGPLPTELAMVSHPPYTVAPPDILLIQTRQLLPRPPYTLGALDVVALQVADTLPNQPIMGKYMVTPEGMLNLGFAYGSVRVGGMTVEQAQNAIRQHLGRVLRNPQVMLALDQFRTVQQVAGEHLVRPDGTISLGTYGCVYVAGLTLCQIKAAIERHLAPHVMNPDISVDVFAYNSKKYFVIADGGGYGQFVRAFPYTGNETVLDAIEKIGGLPTVSSTKKIWVARPGPCNAPCTQILPVDWQAIVQGGSTCTNYQLFPGDRIYIQANPLIAFDNRLAQVLTPINRIMGSMLMGAILARFLGTGGGTGNNNSGTGLGFLPVIP